MKSNSKRESTLSPIAAGQTFLSFLACAIVVLVTAVPTPARAGVSLSRMARLEASDAVTIDGTRSLFKGYMALGLLPRRHRFSNGGSAWACSPRRRRCRSSRRSSVRRDDTTIRGARRGLRDRHSSGAGHPDLIPTGRGCGGSGAARGRFRDPFGMKRKTFHGFSPCTPRPDRRGEGGARDRTSSAREEGAAGVEEGSFLAARAARSRADALGREASRCGAVSRPCCEKK